MNRLRIKILASVIMLVISVLFTGSGMAQSLTPECQKAKELFDKSLNVTDQNQQIQLLKRAVEICPAFAEAYNNLGLVLEEQGKLNEALDAYQKASKVNPLFPHPLAGIGDVCRKQGHYLKAVKAYRKFLDLATSKEVQRKYPDVTNFIPYVEGNLKLAEQKLTAEERKVLEEGGETSKLVTAQAITNLLTRRTRGLNVRPSIPIKIHFASNSATISPTSYEQIEEIARALNSPELSKCRVRIEGHTDNVGNAEYNLQLSERRAESVKKYLVEHFGIDPARLETVGYGESRPIASNDTSWGRAQNRRVELVNLGPVSSPPTAQPVPSQPTPPKKKIKIAILELDFLERSGRKDPLGRMIAEFLTTSAANSGRFDIVERSLLDKVMKELELGQSGIVEEGKAREIGRMVGASAILTGSVSRLGNTLRIDARLIDVESGEIIAAANEITQGDMQSLSRACTSLLNRLIARLD